MVEKTYLSCVDPIQYPLGEILVTNLIQYIQTNKLLVGILYNSKQFVESLECFLVALISIVYVNVHFSYKR